MTEQTRFIELKKVFTRLHGPQGCLWDRKQTHRTLIPHLREEVDEFISAARSRNYQHMREELGDILLHVMFNAQIAQKKGQFDIEEVIGQLIEKLRRRHPHVFGRVRAKSARQIIVNWKRIKSQEKREGVSGGNIKKNQSRQKGH